ncbi:hypothetical protein BJ742DRAFT_835885 [Cladochytrium replicatum]|nr:hypothetical protein BJ742DRAFT_835885 [Cladochytrium replicatum]
MGQPMPGMMPGQAMYPVEGGYYPYPMPPYGAFRPPMVGRFVQQVPMAPGGQMAFVPYVPGATFAGPMPGAVYAAGPQGYPVAFQGPVAGGPGRGPFIPQIYQGPMMYPGEMVPFQQPMMIPVPGQGWQPAHPDGMHMMDGSQAGSAPSTGAPTPTPGSHQGSNIPGSPSMGGSVSADATTPGAE